MSYLERLIERATDTNLDLENNQIGDYKIMPQHGRNVAIFFIYKDNCKPHYSKTIRRFDNQHVTTFSIYDNKVDIIVNKDYLTSNDISNISNVIHNLYSTFDITITSFE